MQSSIQEDSTSQESSNTFNATERRYISTGSRHKIFIDSSNIDVYNELAAQNAIVQEFDYGSFRMILVDEAAAGGRTRIELLQTSVRDDQDLINLNGYVLDTRNPDQVLLQLPFELRSMDMTQAVLAGTPPRGGQYIVQFAGPVQDRWLRDLEATGVDIVAYVGSNAYVVRGHSRAARSLQRFKSNSAFVQYLGDFEPAFRLSPLMQAKRRERAPEAIDVTVQVIAGDGSRRTIDQLRALAIEFVDSNRILNFHNVALKISAAQLDQIASMENVFVVEERGVPKRMDEAQGQILAGSLNGNLPTGPGYLGFLANRGFNSSQFGSFVVNVVDDATSLTGHPDVPNTRVIFQNNPTSQSGAQGGHGFLNAHIVGGFNNGTGAAAEDANGFNYGLGIAPFARVGSTAIFGGGNATPTAWENTAYGQGARISTNSWGSVNPVTQQPIVRYDALAQEFDRIVRDAQTGVAGSQQLTVVFSAGNSGPNAGTVGTPGTAKNIISVGAGENVRPTGTDGCGITNTGADSANDIIGFSSRGPVNSGGGDGRIKPDIMGPGTHIQAGIPQTNYNGNSVCGGPSPTFSPFFPAGQTLYSWSSGTSHSCPAVAGGAALVYQHFLNTGRGAPSPAMVKAYLMISATRMTGVGANDTLPSNNQGMGRMDLGRAFDGSSLLMTDQTQVMGTTGQTFQVSGTVADTSKPLRVTLVWSDAPGATTGSPSVNNLDLEVTIGATTFRGNVFSGGGSVSGGSADPRNNAESVFLSAGTSGNFTVTIRATNLAGDGVPGNGDTTDQDFALVIYNANTGAPAPPAIGVSPTSLSFTATVGGGNPAAQSLSITNTGGGTLNWTATDNQPWLSVSPASGTAPSTANVSVNISGLGVGTFTGAITISATGATNSPVTVPVTLTISSTPTNLIVNGGYESGISPWVFSGAALRSTGTFPHSGAAYLIVVNANSQNGTAFQQITIPSSPARSLTFWLNVTSSETTTSTQFDRLFIEVRSTSGALLGTLSTFSNLNKGTAGVYVQRGPFSLSSFAGQTVRIQFRATNDFSLPSSFRIDDVVVQ